MNILVQRCIEAGDIPAAVCAYVAQRDYVTFAELKRDFAEVFPVEGPIALHLPSYENIILWVNMSQEWADILIDLLSTHRLYAHPTSALVYMIDGGMLKLPLAKRVHQYKTPHWAPVTLRCVPPSGKRTSL